MTMSSNPKGINEGVIKRKEHPERNIGLPHNIDNNVHQFLRALMMCYKKKRTSREKHQLEGLS